MGWGTSAVMNEKIYEILSIFISRDDLPKLAISAATRSGVEGDDDEADDDDKRLEVGHKETWLPVSNKHERPELASCMRPRGTVVEIDETATRGGRLTHFSRPAVLLLQQ